LDSYLQNENKYILELKLTSETVKEYSGSFTKTCFVNLKTANNGSFLAKIMLHVILTREP